MTVQTRTVATDEADTRLDRWLKRHVPALTQGAVQKMLRTGQIRVDGKRAEANTRLAAGQEVRIPPVAPNPTRDLPRAPKPVDARDADALRALVIHRDAAVLVEGGSTAAAAPTARAIPSLRKACTAAPSPRARRRWPPQAAGR